MEMILETRGLTKRVKRDTLIENIQLTVPRGCVYGLLGPNGAGKSTTLKVITGVMRPTQGEVLFEGHPLERSDLKRIGSLIEQPSLYGNLDAKDNLRIQTLTLGLPESRISQVLKTMDLESTGRKKAAKFSLGMKQRLGLALALLNEPDLLILDEPTNGLDPIGIRKFRDLIKEFSAKGLTILISSHILTEIEQIADFIGIINHGKLIYQDRNNKEKDLEALFTDLVGA